MPRRWLRTLRFLLAWALIGLASASGGGGSIGASDTVVLVAQTHTAAAALAPID